jgi:UDP-N-acetylmuramate dehydrogenase
MGRYEAIRLEYPDVASHPAGDNSVKMSAAWLIQACGWKGKREGNVGSHETQPLVIVNYGDASGNEILDFATKIRDEVSHRFGIELEFEVNII